MAVWTTHSRKHLFMPHDPHADHSDPAILWHSIATQMRTQVSEAVWSTTFADISFIDLTDDNLRLAVPSSWVKDRLEGKFLGIVQSAVEENSDAPLSLRIEVRTQTFDDAPESDPQKHDLQQHDLQRHDLQQQGVQDPGPLSTGAAAPTSYNPSDIAEIDLTKRSPEVTLTPSLAASPATTNDPATGLPRSHPFTFDDFVIGQSNRFAHAAALAVAERPALAYNPLFIYGDAGLGKTHLLRAIANYVGDHYAHYSVRYVSSEEFLNDFVEAIRLSTLPEFKRRYREVDLLLVDDIQFIEGKEGFQEEFFHTFNTLHQGQRQIVVSSDRPPDSIPTLEDRLRSRFKMGLITDIQPPDLETRLAILRQKGLSSEARNLPDDVLQFIAINIKENIRELEGALIRVTAYANLTNQELTVALAEKVLGDTLSDRQPHQITPDLILTRTSEMFSLSIEEITGGSRRRPLVTARQVAMYVMRELTDLSYPAIAREFGGRDHTTVIYAVEKIGNLMAERQQIFDQVTELIARIKSSD